jgi:hypothetical protein
VSSASVVREKRRAYASRNATRTTGFHCLRFCIALRSVLDEQLFEDSYERTTTRLRGHRHDRLGVASRRSRKTQRRRLRTPLGSAATDGLHRSLNAAPVQSTEGVKTGYGEREYSSRQLRAQGVDFETLFLTDDLADAVPRTVEMDQARREHGDKARLRPPLHARIRRFQDAVRGSRA